MRTKIRNAPLPRTRNQLPSQTQIPTRPQRLKCLQADSRPLGSRLHLRLVIGRLAIRHITWSIRGPCLHLALASRPLLRAPSRALVMTYTPHIE